MGWQGAQGGVAPGTIGKDVTLKAEFTIEAMRDLKVEATLQNHSETEIYVFDRLWALDPSSHQMPVTEPAYRFVRDGTLRLLLGPCPLPRLRQVTYRNIPHTTKVPPGGSLHLTVALSGPIKEYSAYFPELDTSTSQKTHVEHIELIVQYTAARHDLDAEPSTLFPGAFNLPGGALDTRRSALAVSPKVELDVLRREDSFDRLTLPGETPEPLQLR